MKSSSYARLPLNHAGVVSSATRRPSGALIPPTLVLATLGHESDAPNGSTGPELVTALVFLARTNAVAAGLEVPE